MVRGVACPGVAPVAPAAPVLPRGGRRHNAGVAAVYQLFGQVVASLQDRFARERVFPLEEGRVYYLPSEVFSRAKLSLALVTTGSLTLLLTVLNPVTL